MALPHSIYSTSFSHIGSPALETWEECRALIESSVTIPEGHSPASSSALVDEEGTFPE